MASEDNRNAVTTDADLDMVVLWVRMEVPSRNSDFLTLASPCRFWPKFLLFEEKGRGPLPLQKLRPKSARRCQSQKIGISGRDFHSDPKDHHVKVGVGGDGVTVIL